MIVSVVKGYVFVVFGFLVRLIDSVLVSPCHLFTFASVVVTPPPPSEGLGHLRCGVQDPERLLAVMPLRSALIGLKLLSKQCLIQ